MLGRIWYIFIRLVEPRALKFCAKSPKLALWYYLLFDKSFHRESFSVLSGKQKHIKEAQITKANYFLLVRNTHRLEKGLLMRPRRSVFGKDYLAETIDCFEGIWHLENLDIDNNQLKWFRDVLVEYFSSTDDRDFFIKQQSERFHRCLINRSIQEFSCETELRSIPYYSDDRQKSSISYDEFFRLCKQRRSVRWFLDQPISRELIDKAVLAANQSPSACNRQPFEFRIFDQKELVEKGVTLPMGTRGYSHTIPVFIVLVGNLDAYFHERDRHVIYIDASLAAMTFMLAIETLGLASCAINWPDIEEREKKMEKFLELKVYQRPILCLGVGYADPEGMVAFSEKRPIQQIRKYN